MGGGRASARNMRSKCRCSYVLQFTFRRAVSCVLHRPPSQVIHCAVLSLKTEALSPQRTSEPTTDSCHRFPTRGELDAETGRRQEIFKRQRAPHLSAGRQGQPTGARRPRRDALPSTVRGRRAKDASRERSAPEPRRVSHSAGKGRAIANDPTAGSPTVTLLRLLLPLNAQVWESSRTTQSARTN